MSGRAGAAAAPVRAAPRGPACRCCGTALVESVADFGVAPPPGALVPPGQDGASEQTHRLHALVCTECGLVQLAPSEAPQQPPAEDAPAAGTATALLPLDATTEVIGIGDPARLDAFARRGIPVFALDAFDAAAARRLRAAGRLPVLLCTGDAMARAADPHDVAAGCRILLAPGGVLSLDLPYILPILRDGQFDRIGHAHQSYFSLATAEMVLAQHGLIVFEAEATPDAGGTLRLLAAHAEDRGKLVSGAVERMRAAEAQAGLHRAETFRGFADRVVETTCALLDFLVGVRRAGQSVVGYGAEPRGVSLLGRCGVTAGLLPFVADPRPLLAGFLLPGPRIPIRPVEAIAEMRPGFVLILPWHREAAIARDLSFIRAWGGRFATPVPALRVF